MMQYLTKISLKLTFKLLKNTQKYINETVKTKILICCNELLHNISKLYAVKKYRTF
jgi:hypothetical protein